MNKSQKTKVMKDKVPSDYKGYVIARKLLDDYDREKYYTYYPEEEHGKPPFLYKTKAQAMKRYKTGKFPADQSNAKVVKYKGEMYLDRY